ncbi:hypothetical protein GCM10011506_38130 [Marivirga lumbricoides]|uniref:Protein SirB1 N-terminal domain-containing protein n=1 Tax=Marivirga lumbricoides TaxID=1046115 RepID=A0ABQ1MXR6_9BACT|nr:hypothetical protein GCM10011506_38130 [Marivirga lumbricoides]
MLRFIIAIYILLLPTFLAHAQVIPNLLSTDAYRPYLTENQKREEFISVIRKGTPKTSEELYKYKIINTINPLNVPGVDPANAFTDYSKSPVVEATPVIPFSASNNSAPSKYQNQMAMVEADMAAYQARKERAMQIIDEAISTSFIPKIKYNLGLHNGAAVERFEEAYSQLHSMLMDQQEIDFTKAVFLVESAYDKSLNWKEFSEMFNTSKMTIERLIEQDGLDPTDNMAKVMSIFKYMADTTEVYFSELEKPVITKPMLYDYEDFAGKKDATKIFVSKLLRTGTGQCMSLPMLYYMLAQSLGAKDVHIALAPEHSFIMFKDKVGNWNNIELTGRVFTTDDFQWQSGFVKANQVKSGIYLKPLTEKETIAYLLSTLTLTYIKSFGQDERSFEMAMTAKDYFPNSLTANLIIAGYYKDLFNNVLRQYSTYNLTQQALDNDKDAQLINSLRNGAVDYIFKDLGYAKIPDWHYEAWLSGVKEAAKVQQHLVKRRQLEQQIKR